MVTVNYGGIPSESDPGESHALAGIDVPLKGRKRPSGEHLVPRIENSRETTYKKARREGPPSYITSKWFRYKFLSTYMAYVGQTADPWQMPVRRAVRVMQSIWDASGAYKYKVTRNTFVYQKAVQHCAESWQNVIGIAGITSLLALFDSREYLRDSDQERQEFARYYLKDFRFLYKDTDRGDKNKWRGHLRGYLIVQTFAAHLTATKGALTILGSDNTPAAPIGALALACASVERALTLVATGTLTIARARASRTGTIALPPRINYPLTAPLRSVRHWRTEFSDYSWGKTTRSYVKMAHTLSGAEFETLIEEAQEYIELACALNGAADVPHDDEDPRACIVDDPESDEESEDPRACLVDYDTDSDEESEVCPHCPAEGTDSDEECKTSSFPCPPST